MPCLSLRTKLMLSVLLVLTPVLALLFSGFREGSAREREGVLDDMVQEAQTVAVLADGTFDEAIAVGWSVAGAPAAQSLDPDRVVPYLRGLAPRYPQYETLAVFDGQGDLRGESWEPNVPRNVADRAFFQQATTTRQPAVSDMVIGRRLVRPATGIGVPMVDTDGRLLGVVLVVFDLTQLEERLQTVALRPKEGIGLADPTGRLALRTGLPDLTWEQRDLSAWPEVQAALAGQTVRTVHQNPLLREERAVAFVRTPKYGWVVWAGWATAEAFAPIEQAFRQQLLVFGAVLLVSLLGAVGLATYLTAPVRRLDRQARVLGAGDLTQRVDIRTGDEIEDLGRAFNAMAERLQETHRSREVFISAVAHDLKNLLTPFLGTVQLLPRWEEFPPDRRQHLLGLLRDQAQRLDALVTDLLDVSRIEARRFTVAPAPADLVALTRRVVEEQQTTTVRHRLLLEAPERLEGSWDAHRLAQVLTNLVNNAIKYSPEGGKITVRVAREGPWAVLQVVDQGIGIPAADLSRIFERFQRAGNVIGRIAGTGIGLAGARQIVEQHGGHIAVESQEGVGTTVTVRLPLVLEPVRSPQSAVGSRQ